MSEKIKVEVVKPGISLAHPVEGRDDGSVWFEEVELGRHIEVSPEVFAAFGPNGTAQLELADPEDEADLADARAAVAEAVEKGETPVPLPPDGEEE